MRNIWLPAGLLYTSMYKMCLYRWKVISFIPKWMDVLGPRDIWPDPRSDSPTGCLATEREVEYFKRGCSFSRTRQLAGAMAFCKTKHRKVSCGFPKKKERERKKEHLLNSEVLRPPHRVLSTSRIWPIKRTSSRAASQTGVSQSHPDRQRSSVQLGFTTLLPLISSDQFVSEADLSSADWLRHVIETGY